VEKYVFGKSYPQAGIRKISVGIWRCRGCRKKITGGAWELSTTLATTARTTMNRLKKLREEQAAK